ncbi:hypothetical protein SH501x_002442 [Pirellulaceae bacterium SH501]
MFLQSLKKGFVLTLIASVFLAACWGIAIVLMGRFSLFETRVLLTTLIVAGGSLVGLACSTALRKESTFDQDRFIEAIGYIGLGLTFTSSLCSLVLVWSEGFIGIFWQATMALVVFAIACSHIVLLSLARLNSRFQWMQYVARVSILVFALFTAAMILMPESLLIAFQVLAVLAIFVAAMTMAVPLMHKLYPADQRELVPRQASLNLQNIDSEISELKARISELEEKRAKIVRGS